MATLIGIANGNLLNVRESGNCQLRNERQERVVEKRTQLAEQTANSEKKAKEKSRQYTCKHCGLVASTKNELWAHRKVHLKKGSVLECPHCAFVTKFKHHLDYHLSNHTGVKPFSCTHPNCAYRCINRSMLKSHMKSHVDTYQFRCADCDYATKYAHSLKLHARKYVHRPQATPNAKHGTSATPTSTASNGTRRPSSSDQVSKAVRHESNVAQVTLTAPLPTSESDRLANAAVRNGWSHDPLAVSFLRDTFAMHRQSVEGESRALFDSLYGTSDSWNRFSSLRSVFGTESSSAVTSAGANRSGTPVLDDCNVIQIQPAGLGAYVQSTPMSGLPKTNQLRVVQHFGNPSDFRLPLSFRCDLDSELTPIPFTL